MDAKQARQRLLAWLAFAVLIVIFLAWLMALQVPRGRADPSSREDQDASAEAAVGVSETSPPSTTAGDALPSAGTQDLPPIVTIARGLGFASPYRLEEFADCASLENVSAKVKVSTVCNDQPFTGCPYARNGRCTVQSTYVDGRLKSLVFSYAYANVEEGPLRQSLEKSYGRSAVTHRQPEELDMESWESRWVHEPVSLALLRMRGVNMQGEHYDNFSVILSDKSLPDSLVPALKRTEF